MATGRPLDTCSPTEVISLTMETRVRLHQSMWRPGQSRTTVSPLCDSAPTTGVTLIGERRATQYGPASLAHLSFGRASLRAQHAMRPHEVEVQRLHRCAAQERERAVQLREQDVYDPANTSLSACR
jgi:hypothetical protein